MFRIFGYLKKYKNTRIVIDSRDPILVGGKDALNFNFPKLLKEQYPDAAEEIDTKIPIPKVDQIQITAFVDSDHAHDKVTRFRKSLTILSLVLKSFHH